MKISVAEKLFYSKYPFKIKLNNAGYFGYYELLLSEVQNRFSKNPDINVFRKRREINFCLYFRDRIDYSYFLNKFQEYVIEAHEIDYENLELLKKNILKQVIVFFIQR